MPRTLRPCPSCARHVRSDETTCPFCDGTIPPCTGACASTTSGEGRIGYRAAIVFATAAAALGACGKDRDPVTVQPYGAPPISVDAAPQPQTSQTQTQTEPQPQIDAAAAPVAVYGPPPINKKDK